MSEPRWVRRPFVLSRRTLDSVVVLARGGDEPFALAGTGPELWALLAEPHSTAELVDALAEQFGATREVVAEDVVPLLERLAGLGAIARVDQAPAG